jgi:hypothetical protein
VEKTSKGPVKSSTSTSLKMKMPTDIGLIDITGLYLMKRVVAKNDISDVG